MEATQKAQHQKAPARVVRLIVIPSLARRASVVTNFSFRVPRPRFVGVPSPGVGPPTRRGRGTQPEYQSETMH